MQLNVFAGDDFPISIIMAVKAGICVGLFLPRQFFLLVSVGILKVPAECRGPEIGSPFSVFTKHFHPTENTEFHQGRVQSSATDEDEEIHPRLLRYLNKKWAVPLWITIRGLIIILFCLIFVLNCICLFIFQQQMTNALVEQWGSKFVSLSTPLAERYLKHVDLFMPLNEWDTYTKFTHKWIRLTSIESIMRTQFDNGTMSIDISELYRTAESNFLVFSKIVEFRNGTRTLVQRCWTWQGVDYVEKSCPFNFHPLEGRGLNLNPFNISRSIFLKFYHIRPNDARRFGQIGVSALSNPTK